MAKVLVFGSINMDLVTYVDALPLKGETVTGAKFQSFPGGKGANQAVAAARAGAYVEMYGCVGDDSIGQECLQNLQVTGIDSHAVLVKTEEHSGIAQIMVDAQGENIIAVAPGANFLFTPGNIVITERDADERVIALFQNEIPQATTEAVIQSCRRRGISVVWNTAPACKSRPSREPLSFSFENEERRPNIPAKQNVIHRIGGTRGSSLSSVISKKSNANVKAIMIIRENTTMENIISLVRNSVLISFLAIARASLIIWHPPEFPCIFP